MLARSRGNSASFVMECCFFGGDVGFRYENETPTTQRGQMRPHKAEAREGARLYLLHLASFRHLLRFAAEACMTSCLKDALYLFTVALKHVGISSYGWNTYASEQVPPWVLLSLGGSLRCSLRCYFLRPRGTLPHLSHVPQSCTVSC